LGVIQEEGSVNDLIKGLRKGAIQSIGGGMTRDNLNDYRQPIVLDNYYSKDKVNNNQSQE
jgi:hypothetical protein